MFWLQGAISFLIWIGYGILLARRSHLLREKLVEIPRGRRIALGALCLVGSLALLVLALGAVLFLGGFKENAMGLPIWLVITILGIGFVHAQSLGTAMLVTVAQEPVTRD